MQAVPEPVREMLHRLHFDLHVLGVLRAEPAGFRFEAGSRTLDPFGYRLRRPSPRALDFLASAGQQEGTGVVTFGHFVCGHDVRRDVPVRFSIDRLKSKRSFVFARAGYGKSNLVKLLLSRLYEAPPDVGLLVLDPEGEYAFAQKAAGHDVPGLADHPELRRRLKVFTQRRDPELTKRYGDVIVSTLRIDFGQCEPGEILSAFVPQEKQEQVWTNWLRSMERTGRDGQRTVVDRWQKLVALLTEHQYGASDEDLSELLFRTKRVPAGGSDKKDGNVSIQAIRNNIVPLIRRLHDPDSRLLQDACAWLAQGNIVVLDLSLGSHNDARALADLLLYRLFQERVRALTDGRQKRGVLTVFEEAQTVLSPHERETSIFVRWVKEGRKYGLGALMVTQQPGALAPQLVSQGDNFFVMHLLGEDDLQLLKRINAHYSDDVLEAIRGEPVKGNCYFWSAPDQPYVVPCRVANYDLEATARTAAAAPAPASTRKQDPLGEPVLRLLATDSRVWLMTLAEEHRQRFPDALAVSRDYLVQALEGALLEGDLPATKVDDLGPVLQRLGVLAHDRLVEGQLPRGPLLCWILDRKQLAAACHAADLVLKQPKAMGVRVTVPAAPRKGR
ncbi:MAG: ATP-binding protein [Planctomycetes bacterium]|nr:ATP-binding protein [Planctomycetota bacterium]